MDSRAIEACEYAAAYEGSFQFMRDMRGSARNVEGWIPSSKQAAAILRCKRRDRGDA